MVGDHRRLYGDEVRVRGVAAAGRGQLGGVLGVVRDLRKVHELTGELTGLVLRERPLAQLRQLLHRLGRFQVQRLQTREVGLARKVERGVLTEHRHPAQQGGGVRRVTGLLGGPEGTRLGQLTLALLGQRLGDGRAYLLGGSGGTTALRWHRRTRSAPLGQLRAQARDLLAQPVSGMQRGGADGRGSGGGQQQGK
ncbi:hypothetical protein SCYAM73S_06787 [Streptomyces cyaneofuscatus]